MLLREIKLLIVAQWQTKTQISLSASDSALTRPDFVSSDANAVKRRAISMRFTHCISQQLIDMARRSQSSYERPA